MMYIYIGYKMATRQADKLRKDSKEKEVTLI